MKLWKIIKNGIVKENPIFVLLLGMCPTLAVTTSAENALGMGLATTFVLVMSNIIVSLIKDLIPEKVRIPAYIVVIATFVTIVQFVMAGFLPALNKSLGIFIPLIVVNCIIMGRAEAFASKNNIFYSLIDGLAMGIGFTLALVLIGGIREILGSNKFFGFLVFPESYKPMLFFVLSPGGFFTLGILLAVFKALSMRKKKEA